AFHVTGVQTCALPISARKAAQLADEARASALFDKRLAQEEVWIRKGVEARRTRNEGRVRALLAMREEHRARRDRTGQASMAVQGSEERRVGQAGRRRR